MRSTSIALSSIVLVLASFFLSSCHETIEVTARKRINKTEVSEETCTLEVFPGKKGETYATFKGEKEGYPVFGMKKNKKYKYYIKVDSTYYLFNLK